MTQDQIKILAHVVRRSEDNHPSVVPAVDMSGHFTNLEKSGFIERVEHEQRVVYRPTAAGLEALRAHGII